MTTDPIRLLQIEDSLDDAILIQRTLTRAGLRLDAHVVSAGDKVRRAMTTDSWDVILCDYALPDFSLSAILDLYRSAGLDVPFVIVSGTIGEERAVSAMKAGAHDYVLKHNLARLPAVIERELREAHIRRDVRAAESRAMENAMRFRTLADAAPVLIWTSDANLNCTYVNQRWLDFTGRTLQQELGWGWTDTLDANDLSAELPRYIALTEQREAFNFECRMRRATGEYRWMLFSGCPRYEGDRFSGYVGSGIDLTDRKLAEDSHRRLNDKLQQLAFIASHDMREPLRTIAIYSQLLERRNAEQLDGNGREYLGFVRSGVQRMRQLMDDVLLYSEVSLGERTTAPVRLSAAVDSAIANISAAVADSEASITTHSLPEVFADPRQISLVFQNLISNAIKYRSEDAPRIEIAAHRANGEWVISVSDNGIGIDPQYATKIFQVFKRLHGTEYPGTGIGLAVCQSIVESHGGRIWVTPNRGKGSTFHFSLPAATPE